MQHGGIEKGAIQPALLTRSELDWLLGKKQISKLYERKIKHSIKKKIQTLTELEIPLLAEKGFSVTTYCNSDTTYSNASGLGLTSLVGRGNANLEVKSNNVVSDKKDKGAGSGNIMSVAPFSAFTPRHFEPTCPFGHGISNFNEKDFEKHLKLQKKSNYKQIFCYAQKYKDVLLIGDARVLTSLQSAQRRHAMEGLAALSKYAGCHDVWKSIREKYQLRWSISEQENLKYFTNYMTGKGNFDEMVSWLHNAISKLPSDTANILLFNTITGLRPTEAVLSIQLIKSEPEKYVNKNSTCCS